MRRSGRRCPGIHGPWARRPRRPRPTAVARWTAAHRGKVPAAADAQAPGGGRHHDGPLRTSSSWDRRLHLSDPARRLERRHPATHPRPPRGARPWSPITFNLKAPGQGDGCIPQTNPVSELRRRGGGGALDLSFRARTNATPECRRMHESPRPPRKFRFSRFPRLTGVGGFLHAGHQPGPPRPLAARATGTHSGGTPLSAGAFFQAPPDPAARPCGAWGRQAGAAPGSTQETPEGRAAGVSSFDPLLRGVQAADR